MLAVISNIERLMTASIAPFFLHTFANLELTARQPDGSRQVILPRGKPLAVLAYCASARQREHGRDTLATLLWSDAPPDRARHNVRQALWRLRKLLGDLFVTREDAVVGVGADLASDRDLFLDAVYRNDAPDALGWYEGPFLGGVTIPGGDEFDDWASGERRRLEEALLQVAEPYLRGDVLRMKPSERRSGLEALLQKVPSNPDSRWIAIDVLLDMDDRVAAQGEADVMEQLAQQQDVTLSPACAVSLARARERVDKALVSDPTGLSLNLVGRDDVFARVVQA
jgi:DNA-binding SARP family transcriptional activator